MENQQRTSVDFRILSRAEQFNAVRHTPTAACSYISFEDAIGSLHSGDGVVDKVLEYTQDIRPVLAAMRDELIAGHAVSVIAGYNDGYWQWDEPGLTAVMQAAGMSVVGSEMISDTTFKLNLACTGETYAEFLRENHLPLANIEHIIVTTEHADYRVTGGIGSYVKECNVLYGEAAGIVILDDNRNVDLPKIQANNWMAAQQFLTGERIDNIEVANFDTLGDLVLETLESVLCLYPHLKSIEAQELLLHRAIEAKKIGYIPADIKLITMCHGSSFHLAKAKRSVIDAENIHVAYREKFTIEESDVVIFPTHFLQESYKESGVDAGVDKSRIIKRLPFDFSRLPQGKKLQSYRRLIYIGKTSTIKGFDLFLETLLEIEKNHPDLKSQVEEVIVMATSTKIEEEHLQNLFRMVEATYNITMVSLNRENLLRTLAEYSQDSLALVTYQGDNHPLAILELMAIGHDFIAADAAGTPELILPGTEQDYLVAPSAVVFAQTVQYIFKNASSRSIKIQQTSRKYKKQQEAINKSYKIDELRDMPVREGARPGDKGPIHATIVRAGKSDKAVKLTKASLNNQTLQPETIEVIEEDRVTDTALPGYVIRLYAGDVLYPTALEDMMALLVSDATTSAVMVYEDVPMYNGLDLKSVTEFHPFAPELGSVFLQEKYSRRVVALMKDDTLDNSFTDWQKLIGLSCARKTIRVVPRKLGVLTAIPSYPDHNPLHVSSQFARSYQALPLFDATILYAELKRFDDIYWGNRLMNHMHNAYIRRDDPSISYNVPPTLLKIADLNQKYIPNWARRGVYLTARTLYRLLKKLRLI